MRDRSTTRVGILAACLVFDVKGLAAARNPLYNETVRGRVRRGDRQLREKAREWRKIS